MIVKHLMRDVLSIGATEFREIVDLSELMNNNSDAKVDNEILIKAVTLSNALHCLETEEIPQATPWWPSGSGHEFVAGVSWVRVLVPQKTHRVEKLMHKKSVEAQSPPVGGVFQFGEVSSSSLDLDLKLRGPSPIALVLVYSTTLIYSHPPCL
ncbi:hypothetical protein TNCV_3949321 [Trichonephila clavipes]|nr:hypothetical protein TNCV_3949321 [Trichonephila clavipes]